MSTSQIVITLVQLALTGGAIGAVVAYIRDRKKHAAENYVAENTRELLVDNIKLESLETRFGLAQKAWDAERASLLARIGYLEDELRSERAELATKEAKIASLEERVTRVQSELRAVTSELADLRRNAK